MVPPKNILSKIINDLSVRYVTSTSVEDGLESMKDFFNEMAKVNSHLNNG